MYYWATYFLGVYWAIADGRMKSNYCMGEENSHSRESYYSSYLVSSWSDYFSCISGDCSLPGEVFFTFSQQLLGEAYLPFPILWAWFKQKHGKMSESLKGSDPHMAILFWAGFCVIAAAWEHNKHTHITHRHNLSRCQDTRLDGNEISPLPGVQGLINPLSFSISS